MHKWLWILTLFIGGVLWSQEMVCTPEDRNAFSAKIEEIKDLPSQTSGSLLVSVGETFLGTPYVSGTLEVGELEQLVINLRGLDCTTFVESVLAFSILIREKDTSFDNYLATLQKIRYRNGKLSGYASRLHYFSEWIRDNERKGLVKDISATLGGIPAEKARDFMTSHRDLYPRLSDLNAYQELLAVEKQLEKQPYFYVPGSVLSERLNELQHGDIIALATNINGLDVTHTGIIYKNEDGVLHLMHASSKGRVEISEKPLLKYLAGIQSNTGILVARPVF
ncbi:DUF1460 domain-containing protein [Flavobacteriaceae bacterium D16]|nr:DUF1460 domain-containing protein [Flavobacteriaceae bacterium D16]